MRRVRTHPLINGADAIPCCRAADSDGTGMSGRRATMRLRRMLAVGLVALALAGPARAAGQIGDQVQVTVMGVVAPYSTFGLIKHLMGIPGVARVQFNLLHGVADMQLQAGAVVTDEQIRAAVRSASYTPGKIRRMTPPAASTAAGGS